MLVTVGTEHYAFDRLLRWVGHWLDAHGESDVHCLVQYGSSTRPAYGRAQAFMAYEDMVNAMRAVDVIVCHGGTGSIVSSRLAGIRPIVVPRTKALGEHVDDHQVSFARRLARLGQVDLAESEETLHELLDAVMSGRTDSHVPHGVATNDAVRRFEMLADALAARPARRGGPGR